MLYGFSVCGILVSSGSTKNKACVLKKSKKGTYKKDNLANKPTQKGNIKVKNKMKHNQNKTHS